MGNKGSKEDNTYVGRGKSKSVHVISDPKGFKNHINVKFDKNGKI